MKKLLLFLLLGSLYLPTQAQYFGLESSVWTYPYQEIAAFGNYIIEFDHDTVLQGHAANAFRNHRTTYLPQPDGSYVLYNSYNPYAILRFASDSVFWWKNEQFLLLYDFGADVGDTWVADIDSLPFPQCEDTMVVEVVGVGTIVINGLQKRYIDLETISDTPTSLSGRCVEVLGLLEPDPGPPGANGNEHVYNGFIPGARNCIPNMAEWYIVSSLCDYQDSVINAYIPTGAACNGLEVGVEESISHSLNVHPNPTTGIFTIDLPTHLSQNSHCEVLDLHGRVVLSQSATHNAQLVVNLSGHTKGLYLIRLLTAKEILTARVIKE